MSAEHTKGNTEGARALFNKRLIYRSEASMAQSSNAVGYDTPSAMVSFIAEKFLYGRVNRDFVPIAIQRSQQKQHLKTISAAQSQETNMRALHFVVDAFNGLAQQFNKCAMEGKIDITDPFLSQLKAFRAFEDPSLKYQQYMKRYNALFKVNANSNPAKQIENFDQFQAAIVESVNLTGMTAPVTYTGFIKSRRCLINVSGLVIEVANLDASNDEEKVAQFLQSKNWDFFVNAAATYGFMIDETVPWRLVADIGSSTMIEYAAAYGLHTTDDIISRCYRQVAPRAAARFANQMFNTYNKIKPAVIVYSEECGGRPVMNQRTPAAYRDADYLKGLYGNEYFLSLYCKMRFAEEESEYSKNEREALIKDTLQNYRLREAGIAISKFERSLNKTFDYVGSLSYYNNYAKLNDEQQEVAASERDAYEAYGSIPQAR